LKWQDHLGQDDFRSANFDPIPIILPPNHPAKSLVMNTLNTAQLLTDYERDGVVLIPHFLSADEVAAVRAELERYIRDDLAAQPVDARTFEKDETTVRNLWRLEKYNEWFRATRRARGHQGPHCAARAW
jgi:hypothetical protein